MLLQELQGREVADALMRSNVSVVNAGRLLKLIRKLMAAGKNIGTLLNLIDSLIADQEKKLTEKTEVNGKAKKDA